MIYLFYSRGLYQNTPISNLLLLEVVARGACAVYYDDNPGPGPGPETAAAVVTLAQLPAASGPSFLSSS